MADVDVCISSHLEEELDWAVGKRLRVASAIMLHKTTNYKELKEISCFKFRTAL